MSVAHEARPPGMEPGDGPEPRHPEAVLHAHPEAPGDTSRHPIGGPDVYRNRSTDQPRPCPCKTCHGGCREKIAARAPWTLCKNCGLHRRHRPAEKAA